MSVWVSLGYIVLLLTYGLVKGGKAKSWQDFAGAPVHPGLLVITASMCASFIGGGFSLGNAERAYSEGIANTLLLFGFSAGQLCVGLILAPRFKRFAGLGVVITAGGIIGRAAGDSARMLCGMLSALFCVGVMGAQINAIGMVGGYLFDADPKLCSIIGFVVIMIYSTLGGLKASLKSDAVQIAVLGAGLPLALLAALGDIGGLTHLFESVGTDRLVPTGLYSSAEYVSMFFTFMLGEMLCPPVAQRMLISDDAHRIRGATVLSGLLSIPFFAVTGLIGLCALALGTTGIPAFAMPSLISSALGPFAGGIICAAMLCIYLSSGGAFLNSCALALCEDVVSVISQKDMGQHAKLRLARRINIICGCAAFAAAVSFDDVLSILVMSYGFWAPVILVPLVLALFGKSFAKGVFMAASAAAALALIVWRVLDAPFGLSPMLAGLLVNAAAYLLLPKNPDKRVSF